MQFPIGSRVRARGLSWDVMEAAPAGAQQRLRLRCAEGDLRDLEWTLLHPFEPVLPEPAVLNPDDAGPISAWRLRHTALLLEQSLGPGALVAAEPGMVAIEPYQLVPLMRALELPRARLLLADGVGLGKTIEASLIIVEMIARRRAHRVLIIAPSGPLLAQWDHELRHRFGLRFTVLADSAALEAERRRHPLGGNPFGAVALVLTSMDFAKQERVLEELERTSWDLAIIDEVHHCFGPAQGEGAATQRRRLAEVVARHSDGLLLLTATPHDGNDAHFASLIELLDPSLVDGRGGMAGPGYRRHVVRRLKSHLRDLRTGKPMFRERRMVPVAVNATADVFEPARRFHNALSAFVLPRITRAIDDSAETDALAFVSLLKRSVSTIAACVATLRVVAERYARGDDSGTIRRERARALRAYRRRLLRYGMLDNDQAADAAALETEGMAAELRRAGVGLADELARLITLGEKAVACDPKLAALRDEVKLIRASNPSANILIYTEYADSQAAVVNALRDAGEVLSISGLDDESERVRVAARFAHESRLILVSTDTLAEGLNLHQRCHHLVHLDLPYNPNRLEQRNGRIDRYGQLHDPEIRYLYLAGTFEERLLLRLIARYEKARSSLTFMPDTLGVTADEAAWASGLIAGFAEQQASLFDDEPSPVRTLDRAAEEDNAPEYRDLLREIGRAFESFEHVAVRHGWMAANGLSAGKRALAAAVRARDQSALSARGINLLQFVARAVETDGGSADLSCGVLRLPPAWTAGLEGLPAFDPATATITVAKKHNSVGKTVLGRAHPLVRKAIARVLGRADGRIAVVSGAAPGALFTYHFELRSQRGTVFQQVIAVFAAAGAAPRLIDDPGEWLRIGADDGSAAPCDARRRTEVIKQEPRARAVARGKMQSALAQFAADHQDRLLKEREELERWLLLRANAICGNAVPHSADLFGAASQIALWRRSLPALDRLAAFAADPENPTAKRRDAQQVIEMFRVRTEDQAARGTLLEPLLHPVALLAIVPGDRFGSGKAGT